MSRPRVGLIGASGYSRVHLEHLWTMHVAGELVLAVVVVINPTEEVATCERLRRIGCVISPHFPALLSAIPVLQLDLCIVPTPIHLHQAHAVALLGAGVNVLVEKPLAPTVGAADQVARAAAHAGRVAAVGFQYLHATEVRDLKQRLVAGQIGRVRRISVFAAWPRSHTYYRRNGWAGRVLVRDAWVLDSPVANAMAHFFLLLLYFAGDTAEAGARIRRIAGELYRAQDIDSFDTAALTLVTTGGCELKFYGTHSSREVTRPVLAIEGEQGRAEWQQDSHAWLEGPGGRWQAAAATEAVTRERMLRDVLGRLGDPDRFVCTPEFAREHVRCVNALQAFVPITAVPGEFLVVRQQDEDVWTHITGVDEAMARAFAERTTLREAGAPWAVEPTVSEISDYAGFSGA